MPNSFDFAIFTFLQGVQSVVTHSLQSILHSLGGIQVSYVVGLPFFLASIARNSQNSLTPLTSRLAMEMPFPLQQLLLQLSTVLTQMRLMDPFPLY